MDKNQLLEQFRDPPAAYRSAPLWVWNDEMTRENIRAQLTELKAHGMGGAFVHPRPGLITEYLSEEWFGLWGYALETAGELGMKLYIYDENSYPSGFAGGHVSARLPDCWATSATYRIIPQGSATSLGAAGNDFIGSDQLIKAYTCRQCGGKLELLEDITLQSRESWSTGDSALLLVEMIPPQLLSWLGGYAYVDLLQPEVTQSFLETTYEAYYERFGEEFGKTIPAIFTDEPGLTGSALYSAADQAALPYSAFLAAEFQRRRGYSLLDHLPAVFLDLECGFFEKPAAKIRYDFYVTVRELWTQNFIRPLGAWCGAHNIALTGHFMEHLWPHAAGEMMSPSVMQNYVYQQWPGVDLLLSDVLRDRPAEDILVALLELRSVANQFGKERVLCEAFGAGGWVSDFRDYKRMGDYLMVNGINLINEHLTYSTAAGARKRDHPQSFDWRQSWWDDFTDLGDYFGRVCTALSQGVMEQRLLVLHPTTTGYLVAKEKEQGNLMRRSPITSPDMRGYLELLQSLTDRQWDFDLGDEGILREHGRLDGAALRVEGQAYGMLILHSDMKNFERSTAEALQIFLDAGGQVVSLGVPGGMIDGEADEKGLLTGLAAHKNWLVCQDLSALLAALEKRLPSRVQTALPLPRGVSHMRRVLDDGTKLYFFVNHSMGDSIDATLRLEGGAAWKMDCWSGDVTPFPVEDLGNGNIAVPLRLKRSQSLLLLVGDGEDAAEPAAVSPAIADIELSALRFVGAEAEEDNVLVLDYCDLHLDGRDYLEMNVIKAGELLFQSRGFGRNPWDNAVQYQNRLNDRNRYGKDSGFRVEHHFHMAPGAQPACLRLAVERAAYYKLCVNGRPAVWSRGESWLDHHNGMADLLPFVRPGRNTISLSAAVFDIRLELEPVYLLGDFVLQPKENRWTICPFNPLGLGSWKEQGYPFYAGAVNYRFELDEGKAGRIFLPVNSWQGTSCSVWLNGERVSLMGADGDSPVMLDHLRQGKNSLTLRVTGSMKNLLGPHHDPEKRRDCAWPKMWKQAPVFGQPKAEDYDLMDFGLMESAWAKE